MRTGSRTVRICVASWAVLLPALACAQTYNISLTAGTASTQGFLGDSGQALSAELDSPSDVWVDSNHNLYIVDKDNGRIRKVAASSGIITTVAGSAGNAYAGDGGPAVSASMNVPNGIAFDSSGNMFIADTANNVVRKVNSSGTISTVAGNGFSAYSGDGGPATSASLSLPTSVAFDAAGNLYIADSNNSCIRLVTPDQNIHTFAGQCSYALFVGDGGPAIQAKLNKPYSVAVDAYGSVYISDTGNQCLRKVTPGGIINTIAGTPTQSGFAGDNGPALQAKFYSPSGIALDASGNIYIADKSNSRIRKILPSGIVTTIAGNGSFDYSGSGGAATGASLNFPQGVGVDASSGAVYIADTQNEVVRELTISNASSLPAVSKGGVVSAAQFGALASPAPGSWIEIYGTNLATDTRLWAASDFTGANGQTAPTSLDGTTVTIGGQRAYVDYISPGQVNVQVPATTPTGTQPIVVTSGSNVSPLPPQTIAVSATAPGLYAPSQLLIGGNQYVGALFPIASPETWVLPPGAITGFTSQRAKPGDIIILYGTGFGGNLPAGQIEQGTGDTLPTGSFQISFGGTAATVKYAGLTPGSVGLYQFNVEVPSVPANDLTPVTFTLGGVAGTQTLFTAIGN